MFGKIFYVVIVIGIFLISDAQIAKAQTCSAPAIGLVSSWSGDGNALDARSRNNGTLQNGVTYAAGQNGQAFNLAGNNGDRVLIGNPVNLRLIDHTVEAWVKRSSSTIVTNSPNGSGVGIFFAYGAGGYAFYIDQLTGKLKHGQVGSSEAVATNLAITDTNWHHVAVTRKGREFTGGTQTIFYLDGVADLPNNYSPPFTFTTSAAIGARGDGSPDNAFFGLIDELAIYDRALAPADIAAIAAAGTAGKCKPLATVAPDNQVLWLAGDGDALDSSGNGNHGTAQNGASYTLGTVGQAFNLDGTDDYVSIPASSTHDVGTSGGFTLETWINPTVGQKDAIVEWSGGGNYGAHFFLGLSCPSFPCAAPPIITGALYANVIDTGNVNHQFGTPNGVVANNVWSHVALTYDKGSGTGVIYVNGTAVETRNLGTFTPKTNLPLIIGARTVPDLAGCTSVADCAFNGKVDETSIYNRALSAAEIQSIANAGLAGKYKVQSTVPSGIVGWYPGDSNTNDLQSANNGTLQGGATYAAGKVGQAFSLNGTNAYVTAPSTPANDPTGAAGASMEAWFYLNQLPSSTGRQFYIVSKSGAGVTDDFDIHIDPDNFIKTAWGGGTGGFFPAVQAGVWYHVVVTYVPTDQIVRLYVNGVFVGTAAVGPARTPSGAPLDIGHSSALGGNRYFDGLIDEAAVYDRTLSQEEVRDQHFVGRGGKYKGGSNPTISNVSRNGDLTAAFAGVTSAGAVNQTPIDLALLPALPAGATSVGLSYNISSTVVSGGPTSLCFRLPALSDAQFFNLGVLHLENGMWIDRAIAKDSANRVICASSPTLSPFAIARVLNPTSASVSIAGRATTASGSGIRNAVVTLTDSSGQTRTSRTGSLGYYRFEDVAVGENYVLSAKSKQFTFADPTRIISVSDDVMDADFTEIEVSFNKNLRKMSP